MGRWGNCFSNIVTQSLSCLISYFVTNGRHDGCWRRCQRVGVSVSVDVGTVVVVKVVVSGVLLFPAIKSGKGKISGALFGTNIA